MTRVASESDMGSEVAGQLFEEPRALILGAVILVGMAFVPGFPTVAFLVLAAILGGTGYLADRRKAAREAAAHEPGEARGRNDRPTVTGRLDRSRSSKAGRPAWRLMPPSSCG